MQTPTLWPSLPTTLEHSLLLSSEGEKLLLAFAESLLEAGGNELAPDLFPTFSGFLLSAWESSLLSAKTAGMLLTAHEILPCLNELSADFCSTCASLKPSNPAFAQQINTAIANGDLEDAKNLTVRFAAQEPGNLFWLRFAQHIGLLWGELDWYEPWLENPPMPRAFARIFRADYAFARKDWQTAADLYALAYKETALVQWLVREGECHLRMGDRAAAVECWRRAVVARPWQTNLLLRLVSVIRNDDLPAAPPSGRGEILLYSWNHGFDLQRCLEALHASELYGCPITVLNNGSTDNTAEILKSWHERTDVDLRVITLPVNIGAPAARNWLLGTEQARAADWVVFLDDDALVPKDWLGLFGRAMRNYPNAAVVGCRIHSAAAPMALQSVDLHFECSATGDYKLCDTHLNTPDFGQYSYLRPALSVTGCCHCITRKSLDAHGHFDLRFSPSQFDDLERDFRVAQNSGQCIYQGFLSVGHIKHSGLMAGITPWQKANIQGNLSKLWGSYSKEAIIPMAHRDWESLRQDFLNKLSTLGI